MMRSYFSIALNWLFNEVSEQAAHLKAVRSASIK